jgi:tetratricopeptide (TPR) repeat protein
LHTEVDKKLYLTLQRKSSCMSTRLETLLQFYNEDPADPFNIYGLAIEYQKSDPENATKFFEMLLQDHPDYVPTYYQAAKYFESIGNIERAITVYEKGILVARAQKESKAERELKSAYDELMF